MTKEFSFKIQLKDSLLLSKNKKRESTLIEIGVASWESTSIRNRLNKKENVMN